MTSTPAAPRRRTRKVIVGLILVLGLGSCLWGSGFLYLAALGGEVGSLPSRSRVPEVPAGAIVVSEDKNCGSGGCWREILVEPPAGQTPEDLERAMGLTTSRHEGPTLFDPGAVYIGAEVFQGRLRIIVGYE